uniref:Retrovirus-related Pol polyprotein from transposon TNT 1-94 n=1 Tax=Rhizophora mucronata TaxID=61149 RepID=A0A2P2MWT7_RHIMU
MIGHAKERYGLYYLEASSQLNITKGRLSHSFMSENLSSNKEKVWLHHRRLGHPSFRVIEILFPSLFKNLNVENFHCM